MEPDMLLLINQYNKEQEMKAYNLLHKLEYYNNFDVNVSTKSKKEKEELATYIHDNYNKMDEVEMKLIALKCMDINKIKNILLSFELDNYKVKPSTNISLDQYVNEAFKIIIRYQHKGGGFLLEDAEWKVYRSGSSEYEVEENEVLFVNTLDKSDIDNEATDIFLRKLSKRLNMISKNINIEMRQMYDHGDKVARILLWATDKNIEVNKTSVGL